MTPHFIDFATSYLDANPEAGWEDRSFADLGLDSMAVLGMFMDAESHFDTAIDIQQVADGQVNTFADTYRLFAPAGSTA